MSSDNPQLYLLSEVNSLCTRPLKEGSIRCCVLLFSCLTGGLLGHAPLPLRRWIKSMSKQQQMGTRLIETFFFFFYPSTDRLCGVGCRTSCPASCVYHILSARGFLIRRSRGEGKKAGCRDTWWLLPTQGHRPWYTLNHLHRGMDVF